MEEVIEFRKIDADASESIVLSPPTTEATLGATAMEAAHLTIKATLEPLGWNVTWHNVLMNHDGTARFTNGWALTFGEEGNETDPIAWITAKRWQGHIRYVLYIRPYPHSTIGYGMSPLTITTLVRNLYMCQARGELTAL